MNIFKRSAYWRFLWLFCFAVSIVASAAGVPFEATVECIPEHSEILLGEPLHVTFLVTNKGENTFYLEDGGDYREAVRPGRYKFTATDSHGVAAKDPYPDASNHGGLLSFPEVKPHSVFSEKLFLPLWIKFERPGKYLVHVERPLQMYDDPSHSQYPHSACTNSGTFDFYVTVLPANSNLLGDHIQQWGEQSRSPEQAAFAAEALAYIEDDRVIPHLLYIAKTYKSNPLESALEGLGRHPRTDSTQALIKMLSDPEYYYSQYEIIEALANMNSVEAKTVLRESLNSPDAFTRKTCAEFLGRMKDRDSVNELKARLTDTNSEMRLACANALVESSAFGKGSNSPAMLARILDDSNPSGTNWYNYCLFGLIAQSGGPNPFYNFVFHGEASEGEIVENKKALAAMLAWANSSNGVPGH